MPKKIAESKHDDGNSNNLIPPANGITDIASHDNKAETSSVSSSGDADGIKSANEATSILPPANA